MYFYLVITIDIGMYYSMRIVFTLDRSHLDPPKQLVANKMCDFENDAEQGFIAKCKRTFRQINSPALHYTGAE